MRIAVVSDLHGNLDALGAVVARPPKVSFRLVAYDTTRAIARARAAGRDDRAEALATGFRRSHGR